MKKQMKNNKKKIVWETKSNDYLQAFNYLTGWDIFKYIKIIGKNFEIKFDLDKGEKFNIEVDSPHKYIVGEIKYILDKVCFMKTNKWNKNEWFGIVFMKVWENYYTMTDRLEMEYK